MNDFKRPRKRFGQNFLRDQNIINKIISAIAPLRDDAMLEIGPGRGAMTYPLLSSLNQLRIVEIDRDLIHWWQQQNLPGLTILAMDALQLDLDSLNILEPIRVVGNLPYNISTPLLFHLFHQLHRIRDMHFMLQKEVVERMTAQPGSKTYGRLSVMTQFYCDAIALFSVSRHAFDPPPKVESAIVRLTPHPACQLEQASALSRLTQQAFSQRRKTLRNSLRHWFNEQELLALDINPQLRPENLSLTDFVRLAGAMPT